MHCPFFLDAAIDPLRKSLAVRAQSTYLSNGGVYGVGLALKAARKDLWRSAEATTPNSFPIAISCSISQGKQDLTYGVIAVVIRLQLE